jgi:hypothetical protein
VGDRGSTVGGREYDGRTVGSYVGTADGVVGAIVGYRSFLGSESA